MEHINKSVGKYRLTRFIGEGGMASVYEGTHEKLGTKVAVKILNPILTANKQIRMRFENEAKFMASLDHPNITRVLDFDEQPDMLAIVMELISGQDLSTLIGNKGALKPAEAVPLFSQILEAFRYAHGKGIVHRDIKPSNIFITHDNQVKILDFGIAKMIGSGDDFTQTGAQIGTPVYMSPEQVKADKTIDHRSDIYSLGVTLFFTLNGKPPYDSTTQSNFEIYNKIVYEPIPDLPQYPDIDRVIKKAIQKDREQRYQSAEEFRQALLNTGTDKTVAINDLREEKTLMDALVQNHEKITKGDEKTLIDKQEPLKIEKQPELKIPKAVKPAKTNENQAHDRKENSRSKIGLIAGLGAIVLLIVIFFVFRNILPLGTDTAVSARQDSIRIADSIKKVSAEQRMQRIADSLDIIRRRQDSIQSIENDSINKIKARYLGDHLFSCYFIGSDEHFGKVTIEDRNGVFYLNGKHEKNGNYVRIEGTVKVINLRRFGFTGTITAYNKSESNPNCSWTGTTVFWASGSRVYWRTQDQSCFSHTGDMDIYFNRSGT